MLATCLRLFSAGSPKINTNPIHPVPCPCGQLNEETHIGREELEAHQFEARNFILLRVIAWHSI